MSSRIRVLATLASILLFVVASELVGAFHFWWENGTLPYVDHSATAPPERAETESTGFKQRLHPYFGFAHPYSERGRTGSGEYIINNMGFPQNSPVSVPFVPKKDDFVVMLFGGSVAGNLAAPPQGGLSLQAALQKLDVLKMTNVIVYSMAQGSGKQPQQLIALSFLLALGQHIDLVINVDGFNEAALGYNNYAVGMHPILPAAQIIGALALKLQQTGESTAEFYELAYRVSNARTQIARYTKRLPLSSTGLEHIANKLGLAWNERRLRKYLPRYDATIKASGDWTQAKKQLSLDLHYDDPPDDKKYEEVFELWLRSSRQMRLLSEANQIGYVHVIQPYILRSKPHLTKEEEAIARSVPDNHVYKQPVRVVYQMFDDRQDLLKAHGIVSAIDLFAEQTQTMYVDPFHYSALGETLLAEFVAAAVPTRRQAPLDRESVTRGSPAIHR
jgi:hypothetical protein